MHDTCSFPPASPQLLEIHGAAVEIKRRDFVDGHWAPYLRRALTLHVVYE